MIRECIAGISVNDDHKFAVKRYRFGEIYGFDVLWLETIEWIPRVILFDFLDRNGLLSLNITVKKYRTPELVVRGSLHMKDIYYFLSLCINYSA